MKIDRCCEYDDSFDVKLIPETVEEVGIITRLVLQGNKNTVTVNVNFGREGDLWMVLQADKSKSWEYDSMIEMGSRRIT